MQPRISPFEPDHFFLVDGRDGKPTEEHRYVARFYYERSFYTRSDGSAGRSAWTVFDGDTALGCFGVIVSDRSEVWMHISHALAEKPLWLTKTTVSKLAEVMFGANLPSVECFIPEIKTVNRNWIERVGFKDCGQAEVRGEKCVHYAMAQGA